MYQNSIIPQDGHDKQDCENRAILRWLTRHKDRYGSLSPIIIGDDLFSRESICRAVLSANFSFIFVCKPESHKTLYGYVNSDYYEYKITEKNESTKKKLCRYKFMNQVPIKDGDGTLLVN